MTSSSSVWSALEGQVPSLSSVANLGGGPSSSHLGSGGGLGVSLGPAAAMASGMGSIASTTTADLWNAQVLANALTTMGDAQYWEESIAPATIRKQLSENVDPSNPHHMQSLLRGMKWLLASISKGRDVSDFYPHVVKLVGVVSLEVRKMVYMYLVQYANHDATTRELSLLSINAFQRGLADTEPWIRALALRVLTSICLPDILQIQILALQKCARDKSPYVRKCAAQALCKLYPRCAASPHNSNNQSTNMDRQQQDSLIEVLQHLLHTDESTMVLSSAMIAMSELCPDRLDMIHACFQKICYMLTDMDEWGQVITLDLLARYCRTYFAEPTNWKQGTAERIDRERRVRRTVLGMEQPTRTAPSTGPTHVEESHSANNRPTDSAWPTQDPNTAHSNGSSNNNQHGGQLSMMRPFSDVAPRTGQTLGSPSRPVPGGGGKTVKRRVVKKGFYSDEEDESTEEEVELERLGNGSPPRSRQSASTGVTSALPLAALDMNSDEDAELDPDHRKLLHAALPLLKSRNSGVVLAVCSLHYYCGVSSIKVRSAMGKALIRIHRDHREIQYVVLSSIRTLATQCPSAFAPFLQDFFVTTMDPPFTRLIKLDILTSLALEPTAIGVVLKEFRTYVRDGDDKTFVCAALRAVGRVVEMARIVYDRHGAKTGNAMKARADSNKIALDCLYGLLTVTQTSDRPSIVGETVRIMQGILQMLQSDAGDHGDLMQVQDPNQVQDRARQRLLMLLIHTLWHRAQKVKRDEEDTEENEEDDEDGDRMSSTELARMAKICLVLPPQAVASALWLVGEYLVRIALPPRPPFFGVNHPEQTDRHRQKLRLELIKLVAQSFPALDIAEREQGIHFASKLIVSKAAGIAAAAGEGKICEHVLSMGRLDVNLDVRDRARFESGIIRLSVGLVHDTDALDDMPVGLGRSLNLEDAKRVLLGNKPASSSLPVEDDFSTQSGETGGFRVGTLSSLVGHQARSTYHPLPPWAEKNSPSSLREERRARTTAASSTAVEGWRVKGASASGFYDDEEAPDEEDDDEEEDEDDEDNDEEDDEDDDEDDEDDDEDEEDGKVKSLDRRSVVPGAYSTGLSASGMQTPAAKHVAADEDDDEDEDEDDEDFDEDEDDEDEDEDDEDEDDDEVLQNSSVGDLIPMGSMTKGSGGSVASTTSVVDDMKGLVLAPIAVDSDEYRQPSDSNMERDSSGWISLIRPEHSGGLSVQGRYLRGPTKLQQAQLMGMNGALPTCVCLQLRLENTKSKQSGVAPFRHIRILPRAASVSSSVIGPRKVTPPPELDQLKPGQRSDCLVGLDFAAASDRDGSLQARLDIKFGSGGIPVDIRPSLGDLLLPLECSVADFDGAVQRMQGFQRVETSFAVPSEAWWQALPTRLMEQAALTPVGRRGWQEAGAGSVQFRGAGRLPASSDPVYVWATGPATPPSSPGQLVVCCDHALAVNSMIHLFIRALLPA